MWPSQLILERFRHPRAYSSHLPCPLYCRPQPQSTTNLLPVSTDSPTLGISCNRIIQSLVSRDWLLPRSIMLSRFIHVVAHISAPFPFYWQIIFHWLEGPHPTDPRQLADLCAVSSLGLLQVMLPRTFLQRLCTGTYSHFSRVYADCSGTLHCWVTGQLRVSSACFPNVTLPVPISPHPGQPCFSMCVRACVCVCVCVCVNYSHPNWVWEPSQWLLFAFFWW